MRKSKSKKTVSKKVEPRQKQTQKQIVNINIEKTKTRKKRTVTKKEPVIKRSGGTVGGAVPITQYFQPSIDQSMRHKRGSMDIALQQQPTIIQQPLIDPELKFKLDKLEKRTQKIKEGLKQNQNSSGIIGGAEPIANIAQTAKIKETPGQPSIIGTGVVDNKSDVFSDAIETPMKPKKLEFEKPKSIFSKLLSPFRSSKPKELTGPKDPLLLEYKEPVSAFPPSTAPTFVETPTGKVINQELELLVRQLHAAHPSSRIHRNTIRSAISKKLKELGVGPQHTDKYEKDMRDYYNKIFNESNNIVEEVPQPKDVLNPSKRKKGKKINLSPVPESIQLSTPASI